MLEESPDAWKTTGLAIRWTSAHTLKRQARAARQLRESAAMLANQEQRGSEMCLQFAGSHVQIGPHRFEESMATQRAHCAAFHVRRNIWSICRHVVQQFQRFHLSVSGSSHMVLCHAVLDVQTSIAAMAGAIGVHPSVLQPHSQVVGSC